MLKPASICLILLSSLFPQIINAQQNFFNRLSFEIGYSRSVQTPEYIDFNLANSNAWGFFPSYFWKLEYAHPISKHSAITPGVQFVQKGFKRAFHVTNPYAKFDYEYENQLSYIELPLHFNLYPQKLRHVYFKVGIVPSFLLEATHSFKAIDQLISNGRVVHTNYSNYALTETALYHVFDIGYSVGVSKSFKNIFDVSFTLQKHFIRPNIWPYNDMLYQQTFLLGVKFFPFRQNSN